MILERRVKRVVLTHKDRLLRFGAELVFALCEARNVEVVILNQGEESSFEEELVQDVLEMITVFSARLYGSRRMVPNGSIFARPAGLRVLRGTGAWRNGSAGTGRTKESML